MITKILPNFKKLYKSLNSKLCQRPSKYMNNNNLSRKQQLTNSTIFIQSKFMNLDTEAQQADKKEHIDRQTDRIIELLNNKGLMMKIILKFFLKHLRLAVNNSRNYISLTVPWKARPNSTTQNTNERTL